MYKIEDFIHRNFDSVETYGDGTDLRVNCPFCIDTVGSDDTKGHLYVGMTKEVCHCFRCGYAASWPKLVMDVTGFSFPQALGELYRSPDLKKFDELKGLWDDNTPSMPDVELPPDFEHLAGSNSILASRAIRYMSKRGFKEHHWKKYGLGVAQSQGLRIIIPIEDNYWQGRALLNWITPKYVNPRSESSHVLFNPKALKLPEVVICEGAFSAMAVGYNAVALVGKNPTKPKIDRLMKSGVDHFIITIEEGATRDMMKLADVLTGVGKQVTVWKYNQGDPADSTDYVVKPYDLRTKMEFLLKS